MRNVFVEIIRERRASMLESGLINEEKHVVDGIPLLRLVAKEVEEPYKTVVFYHGWSASKDTQRMRGLILASFGYQVIIPDAIHHGERGSLDYSDPETMATYFWPTVLKNMEEYSTIKGKAIEDFVAREESIGVVGNSMGGFTASGIFTYNPEIQALVVLNGSANWSGANDVFEELIPDELPESLKREKRELAKIDPINNIEKIAGRPVLLLHGAKDQVVDKASGKEFYNRAYKEYKDKSKIKFVEYERVNHTVTTKMMEEALAWLDKFL